MEQNEMKHTAMELIAEGMKVGSLKDGVIQHAENYGITNIEELFPEAVDVHGQPIFVNRNADWVESLMSNVHKSPFPRIKSSYADLTSETLRAKGYKKSKKKTEDVLSILKRTTTPTTIYKKQKLDRDDMIDIRDFSIVSWIKADMKLKLEEEIARCILIGDDRPAEHDDYVSADCLRPIYKDDDVYSIKVAVESTPETNKYESFIKSVIRSRKEYKGSGNPTLYTTEDVLTELLLLEDKVGHVKYETVDKLARVLRVSKIETVQLMDNVIRETTDSAPKHMQLMGIIVNPKDYSIGRANGGQVSMFDDFDIDYNQQKYLIETRLSGALTVPYSAMVFEVEVPAPSLPAEEGFAEE